jgi:hypothetical protein
MADARWEWTLHGGRRVAAVLDAAQGTETVLVDDHVVSKCARGAKPEGHAVRPATTVTFDPRVAVCILRVDGDEVAPQRWPTPERKERPAVKTLSLPSGVAVLAVVLVLASLGALGLRFLRRGGAGGAGMTGLYRAPSGLFVAHFPPGLAARPASTPAGTSGVVLVDEEHDDAIVLLALGGVADEKTPRDPWLLQKLLHDEGLANVPRADGRLEELARRDDTCLGLPGAVVLDRVTNRRGEQARVWSCAVSKDDVGYLLVVSTRDSASPSDDRRLHRVIDATELTRLGEVAPKGP